MEIKAVLLDIDGTLLDSNDAHAKAWQEALRLHGHDVSYASLRSLIGKGGDKLLKEVANIAATSPEGTRISEARRALFAERHLSRLAPTRGARALLLRLKHDGLRCVVATSATGEELRPMLRQAGIEDLIDAAATSSDAESSKPDPDIVLAALDKAGLQPGESIMLGDTPYDIQAAKSANVNCIALRCGGWWDDVSLSAALAIYDDPADLLSHLEVSGLSPGRRGVAP